jgi:hypothetical protein
MKFSLSSAFLRLTFALPAVNDFSFSPQMLYLQCVEHPCEKCGTAVEDGVPFCPNCNAPQIRVGKLEDSSPAAWPLPPEADAERVSATENRAQSPLEAPTRSLLPAAVNIEWREAMPGATLAGLLLALAWLFPFARILLWMLGAGGLATALYQRRRQVTLTPGQGGRIGAISGLLGFAMFAAMAVVGVLGSGGRQVREVMQQALQQAITSNGDPRAQQMLEGLNTPAGIAIMIAVGMVFFALMFVATAALGGAAGAALFGGGDRRTRR